MGNLSRSILIVFLLAFASSFLAAQNSVIVSGQDPDRRVITTAVPFLTIAPDPISGAMGDAGAATAPNANSIHWNPAKLAFVNKDLGFAVSYTPWLRKFVNDMSLSYISGYKKIDDLQTFGLAMTFFNLGDIDLTDGAGNTLGSFNPREFAIAASYSRVLGDNFSIGVTGKYISSNLSGNITANPVSDPKPGTSIAADIGIYNKSTLSLFGKNAELGLAAVISNIGSKISYNSADEEDFIPTNLRLGSALTTYLDPHNKITFALDLNKLMVPTPQLNGATSNKSLLAGIFGSFGDAPGGFSEELKEIMISAGVEYNYKETFSIRAGHFYESPEKGNRRYFTMGVGFNHDKFGFDFAYLVPQGQDNPLAETLRFGLTYSIDKKEQ